MDKKQVRGGEMRRRQITLSTVYDIATIFSRNSYSSRDGGLELRRTRRKLRPPNPFGGLFIEAVRGLSGRAFRLIATRAGLW